MAAAAVSLARWAACSAAAWGGLGLVQLGPEGRALRLGGGQLVPQLGAAFVRVAGVVVGLSEIGLDGRLILSSIRMGRIMANGSPFW